MQSAVFRNAGYPVTVAVSIEQIIDCIENAEFGVVVLNHTIPFSDRKLLARKTRVSNPSSGILVLHHSGSLGNSYVDLAVDSRLGAQAVLHALRRVEGMLHARTHYQDGDQGNYFVVADAHRNYTFVTDPVCDLLGYDRAMLLELRIDDIVLGATPATKPLFEKFVNTGEQTGRITLRHRSGRHIAVNYWAHVKPDGCMTARWEPLDSAPTRQ